MWVQTEPHPNPLRLEIISDIKQEADSLCSIKTKFNEKKNQNVLQSAEITMWILEKLLGFKTQIHLKK